MAQTISLDNVVTGLNQYAVSMSKKINSLINTELEWEDPSRFRPADYSWIERNMAITDVLQPYQAEIASGKSNASFSGVETVLEDGMILSTLEMKQLQTFVTTQLYMYRELDKPVTEQMLWGLIMEQLIVPKLRENMNDVAFNGVRLNPVTPGTPGASRDTFTGYNQRITAAIAASKIAPTATGAITGTNIYDKTVQMCDTIPAWLRFKPGTVKMSKSNRQKFITKLFQTANYTWMPGLDESKYAIVPGYNKTIQGLASMEGSNRIIIELDGYPTTLVVTDSSLSTIPTLRVQPANIFTLNVFAPIRRGFGLCYYDTTFVNDQA